MSRVTKSQLKRLVKNINEHLEEPLDAYRRDENDRLCPNGGHYMLDHDQSGYALERMLTEGGVDQIIPPCSAREMSAALRAFTEGVRAAEN